MTAGGVVTRDERWFGIFADAGLPGSERATTRAGVRFLEPPRSPLRLCAATPSQHAGAELDGFSGSARDIHHDDESLTQPNKQMGDGPVGTWGRFRGPRQEYWLYRELAHGDAARRTGAALPAAQRTAPRPAANNVVELSRAAEEMLAAADNRVRAGHHASSKQHCEEFGDVPLLSRFCGAGRLIRPYRPLKYRALPALLRRPFQLRHPAPARSSSAGMRPSASPAVTRLPAARRPVRHFVARLAVMRRTDRAGARDGGTGYGKLPRS